MNFKKTSIYSIAALLAAIFFSFSLNSQLKLTASNGLLSSKVNTMHLDNDGILWLGTDRGISQVSNWSTKPFSINRSTSIPVNSICAYEDDLMWVATKGKGIYKYNKKTREMSGYRQDLLMGKNVKTIKYIDKKVFVEIELDSWYELDITTNGTKKIDRKPSLISLKEFNYKGIYFGKEDGLSDNKYILMSEKEGCLFLLTSNGIDGFNTKHHEIINLVSENWNVNQFKEEEGFLLLATNKGYYCYSFDALKPTFSEPSISMKLWMINEKTQTERKIDLTYDDYEFEFDMDVSTFKQAKNFFYRINEGEWIACEPNFEIKELTNGDYKIDFKACDKANFYLEETLVELHIDHPLKKNWIKYLIFLITALVYTSLIVIITRKKYKADIHVLEEAVLEKQNQLNKRDS